MCFINTFLVININIIYLIFTLKILVMPNACVVPGGTPEGLFQSAIIISNTLEEKLPCLQ